MSMNKKGNVLDWFYIMIILFTVGVATICAVVIVDKVDDSGIFSENADAQSALDSSRDTILSMDNMMLFVLVGLSLFVVVSSAAVFNHPALFITSLFLLFIAITVAGVVSNTFWVFTTSDGISATALLFPKITFIMENLPFYVLFLGIAAAVVMYVAYNKT